MTPQEVTVFFSGHNISSMAELAMLSFRHVCPELHDRVVYFNDLSTDDTKLMLSKNNIPEITWNGEYTNKYKEFIKYYENKHCKIDRSLLPISARNSFIVEYMLKTCNTKYAFVSDGDTIFINDNGIKLLIDEMDDEAGMPEDIKLAALEELDKLES